MQFTDNKTGVPLEHYKNRFASMDPEDMSLKSGVPFENGSFRTVLMGRPVSVSWPEMEVCFEDGSAAASNTRILLGRLIMEGMLVDPVGDRLLAYNEMPWGNVYLTQFRGRCVLRLAGSYGYSMDKFKSACDSLHGTRADAGDVAYDIPFLPGLRVRLIMWEGDDEFQPTAQALFSDNFSAAFTAEDIAVVGDILINAMKGRW